MNPTKRSHSSMDPPNSKDDHGFIKRNHFSTIPQKSKDDDASKRGRLPSIFNNKASGKAQVSSTDRVKIHREHASSCGPLESNVKKEKANWDVATIKIFCQVCAEEVHAGNRPNTHFNKLGWDNVVRKFQQRTGRNYDYKKLKNKWDSLKTQFKLWKELNTNTGLGYDHDKNTIDADPTWWENRIAAEPELAKFREGGLENLAEMQVMFDKTFATGENEWDPYNEDSDGGIGEGLGENIESDGHIGDVGEASINLDSIGVQNATSATQEQHGNDSNKRNKNYGKGKTKKKSKVATAGHMRSQMERLCGAIESVNSQSTLTIRVTSDLPGCSIKECMDKLKTLDSVEPGSDLYMLGSRLFLKRAYREMFMALEDDDIRDNWLEDMYLEEKKRESRST